MTIGLISAIAQEFNHLYNALSCSNSQRGRFNVGTIDGHEVVVVESGIGKVNAAVVSALLIHRFDCRTIVFSGVAGGLDPTLAIGDIVIADRMVQCDTGLLVGDDRVHVYQPGHMPFFNPTDRLGFPANPSLLTRVKERLEGTTLPVLPHIALGQGRPPSITYGAVLTGDQYVNSESTRVHLRDEFDGLAVEMEGGAVAQVCESYGIPWLVIRALSDLAGDDSALDFKAFAEDAAALSSEIVRRLLPVL